MGSRARDDPGTGPRFPWFFDANETVLAEVNAAYFSESLSNSSNFAMSRNAERCSIRLRLDVAAHRFERLHHLTGLLRIRKPNLESIEVLVAFEKCFRNAPSDRTHTVSGRVRVSGYEGEIGGLVNSVYRC
jgi:hypothetical protein